MTTASTIKERPILFNYEMVRAVLQGRKTMTRRILTPKHIQWHHGSSERDFPTIGSFSKGLAYLAKYPGVSVGIPVCPFGKAGDKIYVREKWRCHVDTMLTVNYAADDTVRDIDPDTVPWLKNESLINWKWQPSILMPRWASRIMLEVVRVDIERLWQITEQDAIFEGAQCIDNPDYDEDDPCDDLPQSYRAGFADLWVKINGQDSWDENPCVWVIEFKRIN